jgi:hypothetical protein
MLPSSHQTNGDLAQQLALIRMDEQEKAMTKKATAAKPAIVEKILKSPDPTEPEKAQILVEGADQLYRELRIENTLEDENGHKVGLKPGAHIDVVIQADPDSVKPKP